MTNKIGPYDYDHLHVLHEGDGKHALFERKLKRIEVTPKGETVGVIPDDAGLNHILGISVKGNRIVKAWVLAPARVAADQEG